MKEINFGPALTFRFKTKLIVAIDARWCHIFDDYDPEFNVKIDSKGNFVLVGPNMNDRPTSKEHLDVISKNV